MILEVQDSLQDVIWGGVDEYFFILLSNNDSWNPWDTQETSALRLPVISELISVPRRSASSFNSNTVRSCEKWPQFGWVWSNLRMHSTDAQVSGLLTPAMWCLNTKHVMGWDEAPRPIRLKTCCDSSPFCYILLLPRIHRVRQEDPHQLERGAASLSFSLHFGSVCIFPKLGKLVPSNMQLTVVPLNFGGITS